MSKQVDYKFLPVLAAKSEGEWKRYFQKNKKKLEALDLRIHSHHQAISERTDCLQCANCCRSLGPLIKDKDVERISKILKMKTSEVIANYLRIDEDGDMVFKSMPCPFLSADNYCAIYASRPKACREYPHTDRKRFYQIYNLSIKNAYTCPIVFEVMEEIKKF